MKVLQTGSIFKIYDNSLKTHDLLPAITFDIGYSRDEGCYLVRRENIVVSEKSYGVQSYKCDKVLESCESF